ncbi:MAG: hypothetical protein QNJ89_11030 [Acidimicrobiia bacterium]|nr:hypothetical protein [Acidimicrobiia bacterium]
MIDTATIERYMRDANPIPHIDDLDPDEFARFIAAATTKRAATIQGPIQHKATESHPTTPQTSRSRRAWAFAAAFILILASIGIAALVLRSDEAPVTDEPAPPTTIAETTPEQETDEGALLPGIEQLEWTRVVDAEVFAGGGISSVTSGGPGLVAVGAAGEGLSVWTSRDGYEWSVVLLNDPIVDESQGRIVEPIEMRSVTATASGLYAVGWGGWDGLDPEGGWGVTNMVWISPDGTDWTAVPLYQIPIFSDIVGGGPGLVATGEGEVWTSRNGTVWTRADGPISSRPDIGEVTVGGPGLVAVGHSGSDAAVWTSPDGTTWTRVPYDDTVFGGPGYQTMSSVTVGGPGLVAVGGDRGRAAVWTSPDGYRWTRIPHDEAVFGGFGNPGSGPDFDPPMKDVIATDSGLVAVGDQIVGVQPGSRAPDERVGDPLGQGTVWTSPDGTTWSRIPYPESEGGMNSVAEGGPGLVAVGSYEGQAAVWVAQP